MAKTLRVHNLAKELGVSSKDIIEKCKAEGIELANHMATISIGLSESIREWFSVGADVTSVETAAPVDLTKVRKKPRPKTELPGEAGDLEPEPPLGDAPEAIAAVAEPELVEAAPEISEPPPAMPEPAAPPEVVPEAPPLVLVEAQVEEPPAEPPLAEPAEVQPAAATAPPPSPPPAPPPPTILKPPEPPKIVAAGPQLVPRPAELQGPRVVRIEAPEPVRTPRPRPAAATFAPTIDPTTGAPARGRKTGRKTDEEEGEAARKAARAPRKGGRAGVADPAERLREWRDQDLLERKERLASATGLGLRERRAAERRRQTSTSPAARAAEPKAEIEITAPIMLKDFCSAIGVPFSQVVKRIMEHTGQMALINQNIEPDVAELVALDFGVTLKIVQPKTAYERLQDEFAARPRENLKPRPPIVTVLGHVDHGKTSLLDRMRNTTVAAGEAGGITQHIGASRIDRGDWSVTILDTPGHQAFTAMRARGANLTDVVVLVVAADDGVMPQTVEAINHAKAAKVPIVIALNKIDLPGYDLNRIYAQFAERDLTPTEWGGNTDVIKTSATTGQGVDDLLAHLSTLSELLELKADPTVPAVGTVIEAEMSEGQGPFVHLLVQEGTLRVGQAVVCGVGAGRVRTLVDARGKRPKEVGPGTPIGVVGLDELPDAGDRLYVVENLARAKEVAAELRLVRRTATLRAVPRKKGLEELLAGAGKAEIPVLNIIVKTDVQGSLETLKTQLEEFPREKVELRFLHAAVGTITEADVALAQASDAIVVGFQVVPEDRARELADSVGVEIRSYRVIYELLQDVQRALEGLLEPLRKQEIRGTAEVRQVFHVGRIGVVAGCLVSDGVIARNSRMRVVRDGRVVLESSGIGSLRRFKDDVREVRAGFECGIKLESFDDLKPGDRLEAFEIVETRPSL